MKQCLYLCFFFIMNFARAQHVLLPVEINNKWGFIDGNGKLQIEAKYELPIEFNEVGLAIAVRNQKYGLLNQNGVEVMVPKYKELMWLTDALLAVRMDSVWGVIDLKGEQIIAAKYMEITFADNFIHAYTNHHHSIFDLHGKVIIPPTNFMVKRLDDYWLVEEENLKLGLVDLSGREVLPNICDSIHPINDSLILFKTTLGWNYKSKLKRVDDVNWVSIKVLDQNLLAVEMPNHKKALFNTSKGIYLSEKEFSDFKLVSNDLILGYKHHQLAAFKRNGEMYPISGYDDIKPVGYDLFVVKKNHKQGLVTANGEILLLPEYELIYPFIYTVTTFQKDSLWGIVNKKGVVLEKPVFTKIELTDGHARLFKNGIETAVRFNAEGDIDASFNNINTIHIGTKKKAYDNGTHLRKVESVYSTNCFALIHNGEAAGSLIHRDVIKQAFVLFNTCTNESLKSNVKILDANLEDFTEQDVTACIIEGGNFGILHKNGHVITAADVLENGKVVHQHITYVSPFVEGLARVCVGGEINFSLKTDVLSGLTYYFDVANVKGGTWGFIDKKGQFVIPPSYQKAENFAHGTSIVQFNNKWGVINQANKWVVPVQYSDIHRMPNTNDSLFVIAEDMNERGYADQMGNIVIPIDFEDMMLPAEGIVPVKKNGKWGFIKLFTNEISAFEYDEVHSFSDSMCAVKQNRKWGFVNHQFQLAIPAKFESISNFSHDLAFVKEQNHFEIINKQGQILSNLKLKEVFDYEHGVAIAKKTDGYGLIDTRGKWIVTPKFHKIMPFNQHRTAIAHAAPGKHVLINTKGEHISFHQFDSIDDFHEGLALVKLNDKYGYIDTSGNLVIEAKFEEAHAFSNGLAKVKLSKEEKIALDLEHSPKSKHPKYSFINSKGAVVIADLTYDHIHAFSNDMALVHAKNEKFFINKSGIPELDLKNNDLEIVAGFQEEKAIVHHKWNNREFYIDKDGDKIFGKTFEKCLPFKNGVAIVKDDGMYGLLSENGTLLIDFKYNLIKEFIGDFAEVHLVHKYGIMDLNGKLLLEPNAEKIIAVNKYVFKIEMGNSLKYLLRNGKWLW